MGMAVSEAQTVLVLAVLKVSGILSRWKSLDRHEFPGQLAGAYDQHRGFRFVALKYMS
jgi:hypothetical protein